MTKNAKITAALSATALMMIAGSAVSFAATAGWNAVGDSWQYLNASGTPVTDTWRKSGDDQFYLDADGYIAKDSLIEDDSEYYYVNEDGAMVKNTWKYLKDTDDGDSRWYYFGSDGKAYRNKDSKMDTSDLKTINGKKYAFDEEGKMLYGWIDKESLEIADDDDNDAWKNASYYFGDEQDGAAAIGWAQLEAYDDDNDDSDGTYWFYFDQNGKKVTNAKKKINGITYRFNTSDGHMLTGWAATDSDAASAGSEVVHMDDSGTMAKNSWVWAIPAEEYDADDYNEDEYSWWYTNASGKVIKNQVKKIKGKKYVFDSIGRMLTELVYVNGDTIAKVGDLDEIEKADLMELQLDHLYYFSNDEEKDGAMKYGYMNLELGDDTYQFYFNQSSGEATTGFISKIKKFTVSGLVLKADNDNDSYAGVKATGTKNAWDVASDFTDLVYGTDIPADGNYVLVNTAGTVQTSKKNVKSKDDVYFSTDANGYVTYVGTEKH